MKISEICLRRPVLATVINLIIIVTGIVFYNKLEIRSMPNVDQPVISIRTSFFGADAEYMEKYVTTVIENSVKTVNDIDHISSSSSSGESSVTIIFKIESNIDKSLNDVRSKISEVMDLLPEGIKTPMVSKMNFDSQPSLWISFESSNHSGMELTDIIKHSIKNRLEQINEVAEARLVSKYFYGIKIEIDPVKLYQYKLTPLEIEQIIKRNSMDYPAGSVKTEVRDFIINLKGKINDVEEYKKLVLLNLEGNLIRLSDIANVELSNLDTSVILRYNGKDAIAIGLVKDSSSNVIEMSEKVHQILPEILKSLPEGIKYVTAYDGSIPLKKSIDSVYLTALKSLFLVIAVIYLFLGDFRISIVPLLTIPVSIIGAFSFMYMLGFTINTYTLFAMILALGLVVDDAIVVLENIYTHIESGLKPFDAGLKAIKEISFAIIAMTLTLASVFIPVGFIDGFIGKLFIEFAWTLAICVLLSGITALTLTPSISVIQLNKPKSNNLRFIRIFNYMIFKLRNLYLKILAKILNRTRYILYSAVIVIFSIIIIFSNLSKEFMPKEDNGIFIVYATAPDGMSLELTSNASKDIEKVLDKIPEVNGYFSVISAQDATSYVPLKDWGVRKRTQAEIVFSANKILKDIPYFSVFAVNPSMNRGSSSDDIVIVLQSFEDFNILDDTSKKLVDEMRKISMFVNVNRDLSNSTPTIEVKLDKDYASKFNISHDQIASSIRYLMSGKQVSDFSKGTELYPVILEFPKSEKSKLSSLDLIYLKSFDGNIINLGNIVKINETISVNSYNHYNTNKAVKIEADLEDGFKLDDAIAKLNEIIPKIVDSKKITLEYAGGIKKLKESNSNMLFTFLLALVFIYLVLAAQFESFTDPILILLAVPFSIIGGAFFLLIFSSSLNLYSNIGLITLIGLITKNSIMIVEFINQLKEKNIKKFEAIIKSCKLRFRPILMTTVATIISSIPLILSSGTGAESQKSIGFVIFGGMLIGTFFTLFAIPMILFKFKRF